MSSFGSQFRVSTFGESHCLAVGCIIDGCPPGLCLTEVDIQQQLTRRRPGQSNLTTPRDEKDRVKILSGTEGGYTLGSPIALMVHNQDTRPGDYTETNQLPRPSHADYSYLAKYGRKTKSGGGRSSARETIGRVAAGAIAEKYLKDAHGIEIVAFVSSVGDASMPNEMICAMLPTVTRSKVDVDLTRCPDPDLAKQMQHIIIDAKEKEDSIGGTVSCVIRNVPAGLGEPCFDKMEAMLAHAMLSIPATKGFEIGSGFDGTRMFGSQHNDLFVGNATPTENDRNSQATNACLTPSKKLSTLTNNSGGVQGGITNGADIYFRVAFKPPATIAQGQRTANYDGSASLLEAKGRHDPCVVPRAVPIVEGMAALVIMDAILIQFGRESAAYALPPDLTTKLCVMPGAKPFHLKS